MKFNVIKAHLIKLINIFTICIRESKRNRLLDIKDKMLQCTETPQKSEMNIDI
jgi:hypothetical protein